MWGEAEIKYDRTEQARTSLCMELSRGVEMASEMCVAVSISSRMSSIRSSTLSTSLGFHFLRIRYHISQSVKWMPDPTPPIHAYSRQD